MPDRWTTGIAPRAQDAPGVGFGNRKRTARRIGRRELRSCIWPEHTDRGGAQVQARRRQASRQLSDGTGPTPGAAQTTLGGRHGNRGRSGGVRRGQVRAPTDCLLQVRESARVKKNIPGDQDHQPREQAEAPEAMGSGAHLARPRARTRKGRGRSFANGDGGMKSARWETATATFAGRRPVAAAPGSGRSIPASDDPVPVPGRSGRTTPAARLLAPPLLPPPCMAEAAAVRFAQGGRHGSASHDPDRTGRTRSRGAGANQLNGLRDAPQKLRESNPVSARTMQRCRIQ